MLFNTTVPVRDLTHIVGNPTLTSLDGEIRAPLQTVLHESWTDQDRAAFGVHLVETNPPEGQRWTGAFEDDDGTPVAAFEPLPPPTKTDVDAERDRRIDTTFTFGGVVYQSRPQDRENIAGAAQLATIALTLGGKLPSDYRWHGGGEDFCWIAADNSLVTMDAPTVIAFGQAAAAHKHAHIFAARAIKDADPIPLDYADDGYWP